MATKIKYLDYFSERLDASTIEKINQSIDAFKKNDNMELEASFKDIYLSDYLRVNKYLLDNTKDDHVTLMFSLDANISVSNGETLRITIQGEDEVNEFIEKNAMRSRKEIIESMAKYKDVQIMTKNRDTKIGVFVKEYNTAIRSIEEVTKKSGPVLNGSEDIVFRHKTRVSYDLGDARIDITDVYSSKRLNTIYETKFNEIELEFTNRKITHETFYKMLYDTLKIIQDAAEPISSSETASVIDEYLRITKLTNRNSLKTRNSISLEKQHVVKHIPNRYAVVDKADGLRHFLIILKQGIFLITTNMVVKKTDLVCKSHMDAILDGELIECMGHKLFLAFDVIIADGVDYRNNPDHILPIRISVMNKITADCFGDTKKISNYVDENKDVDLAKIKTFYTKELKRYWAEYTEMLKKTKSQYIVTAKHYFVPYGIEECEVFMYADLIRKLYVYGHIIPYSLDGAIYTPINLPYMIESNNKDNDPLEYKWKDPRENSIDFYIQFDKDGDGNDITVKNSEDVQFRIVSLYVSDSDGRKDKPVPFRINGTEQKAFLMLIDGVIKDREGNTIDDKTVVEFVFDFTKTGSENQYKWIPVKTRHDKTEAVIKYGKKYGNYVDFAIRIWQTIINPITEDNIALLGSKDTYSKEMEKLKKSITSISSESKDTGYYGKTTDLGIGLRKFNNWIKSNMILGYSKSKQRVLDIACGRGGDLDKFISANVEEYTGFDVFYNNLFTIKGSAYSRYMIQKNKQKNIMEAEFIHADARGLLNVKSQTSIITTMNDTNKALIEKYLSGNKKYNVLNCQFAIHYFLSDELSWNNFLQNVNDHIAPNGYFLITCFDGDVLYKALENKPSIILSYTNDKGIKSVFFSIKKMYSEKQDVGMAIDCYNAMIFEDEIEMREYLVFPDYLEKSLKDKCEMELVESDSFENMFNVSKQFFIDQPDNTKGALGLIKDLYMKLDSTTSHRYTTSQIEEAKASYEILKLNRYYIFKKPEKIKKTMDRVVMLNNSININNIIDPHFKANSIIIDKRRKSSYANNIYSGLKKLHPSQKPSVYLIRHFIDSDDNDSVEIVRLKKNNNDVFLIYKSPDNMFYPVYYRGKDRTKYIFSSHQIIDDLKSLPTVRSNK